ncbi:hypothetical protein, partial [Acinetobacter baumannii]|uniref:hypothetical protein n=1 Tax=Acinetobacter baumannii TaxID=470 RepID=UPI001C087130
LLPNNRSGEIRYITIGPLEVFLLGARRSAKPGLRDVQPQPPWPTKNILFPSLEIQAMQRRILFIFAKSDVTSSSACRD